MTTGEHGSSPGAKPAPYATDGTRFRGALRHYYGVAVARFAKFGIPCAIVWSLMFTLPMDYRGYALPFSLAAMLGFVFTLFLFYGRVSLTRRCSRVFRAYPLTYRGPVEKVKLERSVRFHLHFGKKGDKAVTLLAKNPLGVNRWPEGIHNGMWFAGDDPFGGAAIVPGTGELFFMQPAEWALAAKERDAAGVERTEQAKRAGIKKPVSYR